MNKPIVFLDTDVIFAGTASPTQHGASHVVLRLGEITSSRFAAAMDQAIRLQPAGKLSYQ